MMRAGTIVILATLAFLLAGSVASAYFGLSEPGEPMPPRSFAALIAGSLLPLGVGVGLVALLFCSHRKGYE